MRFKIVGHFTWTDTSGLHHYVERSSHPRAPNEFVVNPGFGGVPRDWQPPPVGLEPADGDEHAYIALCAVRKKYGDTVHPGIGKVPVTRK